MAFTADNMYTRWVQKINAIDWSQTNDASTAIAKGDLYVRAIFEAVADEIHANARATGSDTPSGDTHDLLIE